MRVRVPKTKKGWQRLLLFIGIIIIIFGIFSVVTSSSSSSTTLVDASTVSADEINTSENYYIDDLTVVDQYASVTGSETMYMVVGYSDATGDLCLSSMTVYASSAIYDQVRAYMDDDNLQPGDCVISGCFSASEIESDGAAYFSSACSDVYSALGMGVEVPVDLSYRGATEEEFKASNTSGRLSGILVTLVGIGVTALALFLGHLMKPKKQQDVAYQPGQAYTPNMSAPQSGQTNPSMTAPAQPTVITPAQPPVDPAAPQDDTKQ